MNEVLKQYSFPVERFMPAERLRRIATFSANLETPFLVVDLEVVERAFNTFRSRLPFATVHYAVKANPMDQVLLLLKELGSSFDVATPYELDQVLSLGVPAARISYGNTIKKERDVAYFHDRGVDLYVTDCEEDLRKLAASAPGCRVCFRLLTEGKGADWPLSRKFGSHLEVTVGLALLARDLGLTPWGLSFHVGSQQRDIGQWGDAISKCAYLFETLKRDHAINLGLINLGGGFPANYLEPTPDIEVYARAIAEYLRSSFGNEVPQIIVEPGRAIVGDAGVIVSEVVMTSRKSEVSPFRWVYLDVGLFGGMLETMGELIKYPIYTERTGIAQPVILAGPTCDSMDVLYQDYKYELPDTLATGDRVYVFTTGAYTYSYSSVSFNGFPPLKTYVLPGR